jgi:hypothetical protein
MEEGSLSFRMFALCVATTCATLLAGCSDGGGGGGTGRSITSVTITSPTTSPKEGDTLQLTAEARDQFGACIPGTTATWSVSDANLAAISAAGLLQAFAEGTVIVTATIEGVAGTQTLTITPIRVSVTIGGKEVVIRYATDRCYDLDVPDQPAHFVRADDGSLVLVEGNAPRHFFSRGADFNSLKRDCRQPALVSAVRSTPESYENMEWLWAVYREGDRWHALIHNEYHDPVASTCDPGNPTPSNPCTYDSITYAVSTDGAQSFSKPSPPAHVVAPAPNAWVPPASPLAPGQFVFGGYSSPSNIVQASDGYYYAFMSAKPTQEALVGSCLIRTNTLGDPVSWRAWDGSGFNLRMTSPYLTGNPAQRCAFVDTRATGLPGGDLVYSTYLGRYLKVGLSKHDADGNLLCGIYFRLSADLIHWSKRQLLVEVESAVTPCLGDLQRPELLEPVPVSYPSIVDHADTTINFEKAGRTPYLYYVRFVKGIYDPISILDRDVVRVPLTFTRLN